MKTEKRQEAGSCYPADSSERKQYVDPICGMAVGGDAPALSMNHDGTKYHFCSAHCLQMFAPRSDKTIRVSEMQRGKNRAFPLGLLGSVALLTVFLLVVLLANDQASFVLAEVKRLWFWVLLLSAGFGLQLGLFVHIRHSIQERMLGVTAEVTASGAVSTGSMIACCSHGLVNLLPLVGISAAAAFLARFQLPFILFGVFSNLVGVTIMVGIAKKNSIVFRNPMLGMISALNMRVSRRFLIITGSIAIGISILVS